MMNINANNFKEMCSEIKKEYDTFHFKSVTKDGFNVEAFHHYTEEEQKAYCDFYGYHNMDDAYYNFNASYGVTETIEIACDKSLINSILCELYAQSCSSKFERKRSQQVSTLSQ